jgi:hypothetical protein
MAVNRKLAGLIVVSILSLVIVVLSFGTASSQVGTTLSLNFPESEPDAFIDGGPRGPSAGDVLFFKGPLTDNADDQVGRIIAEASTFSKSGAKSQMSGTITLTDRGSLSFAGELNLNGQEADQGTLVIVGGTGEFQGAEGIATSTIDFDTGNVQIDVTLI